MRGQAPDDPDDPHVPHVPRAPLEPLIVGSAKHRRMLRRFEKVKDALRIMRRVMAETRRVGHQQADRMHRMEMIMDSLILHFLDPDRM